MDNLTLAITTIGDLLLENTISRDKNDQPIKDISLVIPEYQRPYKWTARTAIQLLDDVIEAKNHDKEVYRVGTLILHREKDDEGPVRYNIVDGQQRTITFSLLLYALFELEEKDKRSEIVISSCFPRMENSWRLSGVAAVFKMKQRSYAGERCQDPSFSMMKEKFLAWSSVLLERMLNTIRKYSSFSSSWGTESCLQVEKRSS